MLILALLAVGVVFAAVAEFKEVAKGFNSPRFITSYNGRLYVTAAGLSGIGAGSPEKLSRTGAVFELRTESSDDDDDQHVRVRQLAQFDSVALREAVNADALGPSGIAVHDGRVFVVTQESEINEDITALVESTSAFFGRSLEFGKLFAFDIEDDDDDNAHKYQIGNPGAAGFAAVAGAPLSLSAPLHQPDLSGAQLPKHPGDSDPYGIYYNEDDDTVYVADAGSNYLQAIKDGQSRIVAYFPPTSTAGDATPTSVTKGPDGFLYVTTLELVNSGFGATAKSNVYRVDRHASSYAVQASDVAISGLTTATGIHYSEHHHAFFIVEQFTGALARVRVKREHDSSSSSSSSDSDSHKLVFGAVERFTGFNAPNHVTTDSDGRVYVVDGTTVGTSKTDGVGRVLRVKV